jgi:hypothetical protein
MLGGQLGDLPLPRVFDKGEAKLGREPNPQAKAREHIRPGEALPKRRSGCPSHKLQNL